MAKKLWQDYYNCLKPFCQGCLEKGIGREEYAFCSLEKKPFPVYEEDQWGRRGKLLTTLENIYQCRVYHWTIFQGPTLKIN